MQTDPEGHDLVSPDNCQGALPLRAAFALFLLASKGVGVSVEG